MAPVPKVSSRIIYSIVAFNIISWTHSELYTSMLDMESLLDTQKYIIEDLDDYLQKEEERLATLKWHLNIFKREHEIAMADIPNYLGNPINVFTLIKRLTVDLEQIRSRVAAGTEHLKQISMSHANLLYATHEDLVGAIEAMARLQEAYLLKVEDLADGKLNGVFYSNNDILCSPMSADDCYELGKAMYVRKDYKNAIAWMTAALPKIREDGIKYQYTEVEVMEYVAFMHYLLGDLKQAYEWTLKIVEIDPQHPRATRNVAHFKYAIAEELRKKKKKKSWRGEAEISDGPQAKQPEAPWDAAEKKSYERLCRGEMELSSVLSKRLYCQYVTENHPFLRLAPFKMEYLYREPDIFVFYDVLSDDEIEYIKDMARPRFKRAVVNDNGELVPAQYRISKSSWLLDYESEVIAKISRRMSDMTTLSMETAEGLQVSNYGIGGHYEPHFDFARNYEVPSSGFYGKRIATVMFYMSDVVQGGATVFTELGLSVFPIKGAALFWMNLHPSGQGDLSTMHAACPVLRGSKWVCNKWIHQAGQELIKPCNLKFQEEGIATKIISPIRKSIK